MRPCFIEFLEQIFGDPLASYLVPTGTTLLLAAICIGLWVMLVRGRLVGLSPRTVAGAVLAGALCGLVGARLFHLLQHPSLTAARPEVWLSLGGGTTSWGGYLGGVLGFSLFLRLRHEPILPHLDLLASALAFGPLISRWGCLLSGCCFGRPSDLPWAITFPTHSIAHRAHLVAGLVDDTATGSLPVHPVQVYASFVALVLLLLVSRFWEAHRDRPGATFALYWLLYASLRFGLEFFRGDVPRHLGLHLTLSQIVCMVVATAAAWGLWWRFSSRRNGRYAARVRR